MYRRKKLKSKLVNVKKVCIYVTNCHQKRAQYQKKMSFSDKMTKKREGGRHSSLFVKCFLNSIGTSTYREEVPVIDLPLNDDILRISSR